MSPSVAPIAGRAVATMVWSTAAMNIGSMMEGKTVRNSDRPAGGAGSVGAAAGSADRESGDPEGHRANLWSGDGRAKPVRMRRGHGWCGSGSGRARGDGRERGSDGQGQRKWTRLVL